MKNIVIINFFLLTLINILFLGIFIKKSNASTDISCIKKRHINGTSNLILEPKINGSIYGKSDIGNGILMDACLIPKNAGRLIGFYFEKNFISYNPDNFSIKTTQDTYIKRLASILIQVVNDESTEKVYYAIPVGSTIVLEQ